MRLGALSLSLGALGMTMMLGSPAARAQTPDEETVAAQAAPRFVQVVNLAELRTEGPSETPTYSDNHALPTADELDEDEVQVVIAPEEMVSGAAKDSSQTSKTAVDEQKTAQQDSEQQESDQQENERWEFQIRAASGKIIFRDSFPDWAAASHYTYRVEVAQIAPDQRVILLSTELVNDESRTNSSLNSTNANRGRAENAPPDAPRFQRAWVVEGEKPTTARRSSTIGQKWRRVGSAESSMLDGGDRLALARIDQQMSLVRVERQASSIFCGAERMGGDSPPVVQVYDPENAEFEARVDIDALLDGAKPLKSELADDSFNPPYLQAWSQWFAASSDRQSAVEAGAKIRPLELGDRKFDTAWLEGAPGLGRGEFVSAQINDAVGLSSVRIVPGIGGTQERFDAFARPTRVLMSLSDGSRYIVPIEPVDLESVNQGHGVLVKLPEPVKTRCLTVMLLDSTPGTAHRNQPPWAPETVAIAQITPYSSLQFADSEQTAQRIVDRIVDEPDPRLRHRIAQMALSLRAPMTQALREATVGASPEERERLLALVGSLPREEATILLMEFLRETDPGAPEYRTIKRGLAALGQHAAPEVLKYIRERSIKSPEKRVDVLRLFGRIASPEQLKDVIPHLGRGPANVRQELIRAVTAGGEPLVAPLLEHAYENTELVGGYDAIQALNLLGRRLHHRGQGKLPRPELYEELLEKAPNRRTQLRILEVARYFSVPDFVDKISPKYLADSDPLVRQTTVLALERYPVEQAREQILAQLDDESPDVRLAAILALDARDDSDQATTQLLAYIKDERWPAPLGRAFRLLAASDDPRAHQALETILGDAPTTQGALLAARELERARSTIDPQLAIDLAGHQAAPPALRLQMLDLLGLDESARGEAFLLDILFARADQPRFEESRDAQSARQRAFMSLGRRRSEPARQALLEIAIDGEDLAERQIALRALAFYKDPLLLETLKRWQDSAPAELVDAIEQTITMIERRQALDAVEESLSEMRENQSDKENQADEEKQNEK